MIAKMTKVTFLVYHKEYDCLLKNIRDLGVVHVATKAQGGAENAALQESIRLSARYAAAIKLLQSMETASAEVREGDAAKGELALKQTDELLQQSQQLTHRVQAAEKELATLEPWGDFDPQNISRLRKAGYQMGFYICSEKQFKPEWVDLYHATVINRIGSKMYFVTVTKGMVLPELEIEMAKLPDSSLEGWIPSERLPEMTEYLRTQEVYYETAAPTPEDDVPILLENKGFFRLFEPIMRLYMLPKYNELDLTPFFAPFFMLFFGLCLGDSGYGLFMLLAVTLYRLFAKKLSASMKPILTLVQILGASTMVCGLLTGTCFGFNLYDIQVPFFQTLKETISLDNQQMFNLSLILGGVQIIFGMILKAVNQTIQFGVKYAIATIGWILILVSTAVAFAAPGLMAMGGTVHLILLAIGGLMAYLYNSPDKNIFVNIGLGLWDSYNMATGLLGDILSYVRLFALGLSGGILASVFNSLAVGMSPDNVIAGPIVMVLIFVIGHAINIFMNVLGAMVHPMRLTFVEFFKNAGYEGGGKEYNPFKN